MTSLEKETSQKKKKIKGDGILISLIILLFLIGAGLMIYPDVASFQASRRHAGIVEQFYREVENLPNEEILYHFDRARNYNESLTGIHIEDPFVVGSGAVIPTDYYDILNISQMMGFIEIPTIDLRIPIFHGTGEDVLMRGVGHIPNTPFPIGQLSKHAVLTGHTAIPTSRLFTDLERLELGDIFIITVLNERMMYQVDQITVVLPHEISDLRNIANEDLVTLVTCTPYAINSHRLLVRGMRIPYEEDLEIEVEILLNALNWRILLVAGLSGLFVIGWLIYLIQSRRKRKRARRVDA